MAKGKLGKILNRDFYKRCLKVKKMGFYEFDEGIEFAIEFYETLVPKEKRDSDDINELNTKV